MAKKGKCKKFWHRLLQSRYLCFNKTSNTSSFTHTYSDCERYVRDHSLPNPISIKKLDKYCWYWGPLSWLESEERLAGKPDGSFLVRDSTDDNHLLTLSFRSQGKTCHFRFNSNRGTGNDIIDNTGLQKNNQPKSGKFIFFDSLGADSCEAFIDMAMSSCREGHSSYLFHKPHFGNRLDGADFYAGRRPNSIPVELQLLVPLNRFCNMNSLKHLCRYSILTLIPRQSIELLPVPEPLKSYLREPRYLIESPETT